MKIRLLLTLQGWRSAVLYQRSLLRAISLGDVKALDKFTALGMKYDEAYNKNDAAALAALFTEDAVLVTPEGMFNGRQDIEKRYAMSSSGGRLPPLAASVVS